MNAASNLSLMDEPTLENIQQLIRNIIYQIQRLMHSGDIYTKEINRMHRISVPQLNCLIALHENGPLPPSRIAKFIMVNSSTVTGIIDRLEQKGFVRRSRQSMDRRVITIELTDEGKMLALNAPPPIKKDIFDGLKKLPETELRKISNSLNVLNSMLEDNNYHS